MNTPPRKDVPDYGLIATQFWRFLTFNLDEVHAFTNNVNNIQEKIEQGVINSIIKKDIAATVRQAVSDGLAPHFLALGIDRPDTKATTLISKDLKDGLNDRNSIKEDIAATVRQAVAEGLAPHFLALGIDRPDTKATTLASKDLKDGLNNLNENLTETSTDKIKEEI